MTIEEALYDRLMDDDALMALVKREIYKGFRSQGQSLPAVTFVRVTTVPTNGATGASGTEHVIMQIDCWARRDSEARKIAEAVKSSLNGWGKVSSPAIFSPLLTDEQNIMEPADEGGQLGEYRISQDWSIWMQP